MRIYLRHPRLLGLSIVAALWVATDLFAASLTINPPLVANDYAGQVSLTISGLTPGKNVLVERFLDLNGNGAVDAGETLTFSFQVTDGQRPFIGGVRNPNVPGDDDGATNGSIRVDLPFPNLDGVFGSAAARFIFRISDPQNGFSPVTALFEVQQQVLPQGVSGKITAATSGAPLPRAVVLLASQGGAPIAAVLADANGNYSFKAAPGSYSVFVITNGFVSDQAAGAVTVVANQFATRNLALASAGFTISGRISDDSSGVRIAGIFVSAESQSDSLFAGGLSDANGNYTFSVTAGQWRVTAVESQLAQVGYVGIPRVVTNTTSSGAVTIDFPVPRATAMIYGTVKDGANNPVTGLRMKANDQGNLYRAEGFTFSPNANYATGVVSGTWSVGPDGDSLAARGYTGGTGTSVTLSAGQAKQADFVVQRISAHLRGQIKDDAGTPIANITIVVSPVPMDPSGIGSIYPTTDNNGNFDVGVRGGTWNISLECRESQNRGYVDVGNFDFNVTNGVDQNGIVLNFPRSTFVIAGTVKDTLNNPIAGVQLDANSTGPGTFYTPGCAATDSGGNYQIKVINGSWQVSVRNEDLNARGFNGVPAKNVTIAGGNGVANFIASPLPPVITSPTSAAGTLAQQFVYQFGTRFATSRAVTNLPPGLTFTPSLSAITGTPTATGTFQTNLSATGNGGTTNAILTITVRPPPPSGPVITSSTSATGRSGQPFKFQVTTTGGSPSARLSASGLPPGLVVDPVAGFLSGTPSSDGSFAVTLTVTDGNLTTSSILQLTFTTDPTIPVIRSSSTASLTPGQSFNYAINAPTTSDPSDVTRYSLIFPLPAGLTFDAVKGTISGTFTGGAEPVGSSPDRIELSGGIVTNVQLFATNSHGTSTIPLLFTLAPKGAVNISTRLAVGNADNVLIAGFIITGNAPKQLIIRAIAPSLRAGAGPLPGTLPDPILELHDATRTLGSNDNWRDSQENEIIATTVPPTDERESAIVATLAPGNYTAIVGGKNNTTGIAVVEAYDLGTASLDNSSKAQLAQISTRGKVLIDDNVMIGGFIISGTATKVIVRAIGPSLNGIVPGALQDTMLELYDGSGSLINSNDDWRTTQEQQIIDTTVPPKDDRESAIVATLGPGNYTGIVRGKAKTTGVALVEVYSLQ